MDGPLYVYYTCPRFSPLTMLGRAAKIGSTVRKYCKEHLEGHFCGSMINMKAKHIALLVTWTLIIWPEMPVYVYMEYAPKCILKAPSCSMQLPCNDYCCIGIRIFIILINISFYLLFYPSSNYNIFSLILPVLLFIQSNRPS